MRRAEALESIAGLGSVHNDLQQILQLCKQVLLNQLFQQTLFRAAWLLAAIENFKIALIVKLLQRFDHYRNDFQELDGLIFVVF